jgi:type IV pilus assembly protein PilX
MRHKYNNENGAVLVTGLVILLIMTLVGIAAMNNSSLQEVMSRNQTSRNVAFHAAEAALREGEDYLTSATLPSFLGTNSSPVTNGLYQEEMDLTAMSWDSTDSVAYSGGSSAAVAAPRFIIEELAEVEDDGDSDSLVAGTEVDTSTVYRVTARGVGLQDTTVVMLQTTYLR